MASEATGAQERTEQPTGKRRDDARREGRVAVSPDLTAAGALLGALGVHASSATDVAHDAVETLARGLVHLPRGDLGPDQVLAVAMHAGADVLRLAWPFLAVPAAVALGVGLGQTGFAFPVRRLLPSWQRVAPAANLSRLIGSQGLAALARALVKLALVAGLGFLALSDAWPALVTGAPGPSAQLRGVAGVVRDGWVRIGLAWLAVALLDWGWQRWSHARGLRMTREEVRQEAKETEGSPTLRARLRGIHRQMAMRRMMAEVPRADVVVRNPTHVAVALRYRRGAMRAPCVVAKGERRLALRILEVARASGVPIVENRPLARALFGQVALGREVPRDLYRAVAEVLAYVYALGGRRA